MRISFFLAFAPLVAAPAACSSSAQTTTIPDAGGGDGALADGGQAIPQTETCTGTMSACLYGTAKTIGFTATPKRMQVSLYKVFPSGSAAALKSVPVALDGTWAFSDVSSLSGEATWSHYYVQIAADFGQTTSDGGAATAPARVVGPLTLPSTGALPVLEVPPVQLVVLEQAASGGFQVDWAVAHVFDPASGAEVSSTATVSIAVGGTSTPMPWGPVPGGAPVSAYVAQFSAPPAAQSTYTVTTTATAGGTPGTWSLVAVTPTFTPTLTSPMMGGTIPSSTGFSVGWNAQASADYEVVELFKQVGTQWGPALYSSAAPDAPDTTSENIPVGIVASGATYLVDVNFANASCPPTASGCVLASTAATAQVTAQ